MTNCNYFAELAYLNSQWEQNVRIDIRDGLIDAVTSNSTAQDCTKLQGAILPTIANLHSHSFQYLMAGLAETSLDAKNSFWSWRDLMYKLVRTLSPDDIYSIATHLYINMLKAGYTQVGEFNYLYNDQDGKAYASPMTISNQLIEAANLSGIGITLLPALYSHSGFGGQLIDDGQSRFATSTEQYIQLIDHCSSSLDGHPLHGLGLCFHSLRAVTQQQMEFVLNACSNQLPIHIHISEQQKEIEDCLAWSGQRPVEWLANKFELTSRWCLIHATHINEEELNKLAQSGAAIGLCPTTEANLGDGIFPGVEYIKQSGVWGIGSDSHISVSITDELRSLEYSQRLRDQQRNRLYTDQTQSVGEFLFQQAHQGGNQALATNTGLQIGQRADFMVLDQSHPFIGGSQPKDIINRWVFACNENVIKDVYVAGKPVIQDFHHPLEVESRAAFSELMRQKTQ